MAFPYELFIGIRYLKAKRRRKGISLNTLISIGGITVGVAALIATLAVMTGFSEEIRNKILGANAHIVVTDAAGADIAPYRTLLAQVEATPHVLAAAPFILKQVLLSAREHAVGVVLRGIDPAREGRVTDIQKNIIEGHLADLVASQTGDPRPGIVIGRELATRLSVFQGDEIHVVSPVGESGSALGAIPKIRKFRVAGIFDSGMLEYDTALVYISIEAAQDFFNMPDVVSGIQIKTDDIFATDRIADAITTHLSPLYVARDWMQLNRNLFSALKMEKTMMFIVLALIVLVASFNIVSTLMMTVIEKTREIAILKAMGATRESIMRIFMLEGVVIGLIGVVIGLPLGLSICAAIQRFYRLPGDVYYITHFPVRVLPLDVALVSCSAILIGLLATLYPSWQAARMDPVEALRYE